MATRYLLLELVLLALLHHHLMLVELLNCVGVNVLEEVWGRTDGWLAMVPIVLGSILIWLLFNPQVLGRLEVIPEN